MGRRLDNWGKGLCPSREGGCSRAGWFVLLAALGCGGCEGSGGAAPRQAVIVLLDAARPDRMSCYGYSRETTPNLDALAAEGAVFEAHYTQGMDTRRSLPCMLFSRYFVVPVFPFSSNVPLSHPADLFHELDDECLSLPALFAGDGFVTAGISAHTWTKPETRFAREFDEFHDLSAGGFTSSAEAYPRAEDVVDFTIDWLARHRDDDFLLYVHLMDTHFPHAFGPEARAFLGADPPPLARFERSGQVRGLQRPLTDEERAYHDALYDGSLRYTDQHLGRLFEALEDHGVIENGVVAVTADHGELLLEVPGRYLHGGEAYEGLARIPLVLAGRKRVPQARVETLTGMVDLAPTLAACMQVELPVGKSFDGFDLLPTLEGGSLAREHMYSEKAIRIGDHKALFDGDLAQWLGGEAGEPDLAALHVFDLGADPLELHDLASERPDLARELAGTFVRELGPYYRRFELSTTSGPPVGSFAIGAWSFELEPAIEQGPRMYQNAIDDAALVDRWTRNETWPRFYLLGKGRPAPLRVRFPVPDGEYEVTLQAGGAARVTLDGETTERLVTVPTPSIRPLTTATNAPLGVVRVRDGAFGATFAVADAPGVFVLRAIGFRPVGGEAEDPRRERTLRTLGYVDD